MKLGFIVEGQGEVGALPVLARRLADAAGVAVEIGRPVRIKRTLMTHRAELERAVNLVAAQVGADGAIVLVLDADDDCPAEIGPRLLKAISQIRSDRKSAVIVANREFEAWFLAGASSLRGKRGLPPDLGDHPNPELPRDAKGWLADRMPRGYSETIDQPAFAQLIDLALARRAPSFDKLCRDLDRIMK